MFSSRRAYYKPRSRQYYKKKRINRKFAPAMYKSPLPDYFQQKGRIIQTSPARIPIIPQFLPSHETLDQMYQALIQANYPGVGPAPSFQYNGLYATIFAQDFKYLFTFPSTSAQTSNVIDSNWLKSYIQDYVNRPPLPDGYEIYGEIPYIYYDISGASSTVFNFNWITPLFSNGQTLISKPLTSLLLDPAYNTLLYASPCDTDLARISKYEIDSDSLNNNFEIVQSAQTLNPIISYIPFITTENEPTTTYLQVTRTSSPLDELPGRMTFLILYKYRPIQ